MLCEGVFKYNYVPWFTIHSRNVLEKMKTRSVGMYNENDILLLLIIGSGYVRCSRFNYICLQYSYVFVSIEVYNHNYAVIQSNSTFLWDIKRLIVCMAVLETFDEGLGWSLSLTTS